MDYKTTSTEKKLGKGPADMANQGGKKPPYMTTSTQVPLNRTEHRVANLENRPGSVTHVSTSTSVPLTRKATVLYEPTAKHAPLVSGNGGRKRR